MVPLLASVLALLLALQEPVPDPRQCTLTGRLVDQDGVPLRAGPEFDLRIARRPAPGASNPEERRAWSDVSPPGSRVVPDADGRFELSVRPTRAWDGVTLLGFLEEVRPPSSSHDCPRGARVHLGDSLAAGRVDLGDVVIAPWPLFAAGTIGAEDGAVPENSLRIQVRHGERQALGHYRARVEGDRFEVRGWPEGDGLSLVVFYSYRGPYSRPVPVRHGDRNAHLVLPARCAVRTVALVPEGVTSDLLGSRIEMRLTNETLERTVQASFCVGDPGQCGWHAIEPGLLRVEAVARGADGVPTAAMDLGSVVAREQREVVLDLREAVRLILIEVVGEDGAPVEGVRVQHLVGKASVIAQRQGPVHRLLLLEPEVEATVEAPGYEQQVARLSLGRERIVLRASPR